MLYTLFNLDGLELGRHLLSICSPNSKYFISLNDPFPTNPRETLRLEHHAEHLKQHGNLITAAKIHSKHQLGPHAPHLQSDRNTIFSESERQGNKVTHLQPREVTEHTMNRRTQPQLPTIDHCVGPKLLCFKVESMRLHLWREALG